MRISPIVTVAFVLVSPACGSNQTLGRDTGLTFAQLEEVIRDSPCDSIPLISAAALVVAGVDRIENEIHDCQQLVLAPAGNKSFGPRVAIYPLHSALVLTDDTSFLSPGRPIATIYNWGSTTPIEKYPLLNIEPRFNCLWLRLDGNVWEAEIRPHTEPCDSAPAPVGNWNQLRVRRAPAASHLVPPTARWGWQEQPARHYIGIRCGSGWCNIAKNGAQMPEPNLEDGWSDEQFIARMHNGRLEPGPRARITPTDTLLALRHVTDPAIIDPIWAGGLDVATIVVEGATAADRGAYQDKFNLSEGPDQGTASLRVLLASDSIAIYSDGLDEDTADVVFLANLTHAAAGAARWRWQSRDETAWISCKSGCCDVAEVD